MKESFIWVYLTNQYMKNPIGYSFITKEHEIQGWKGIWRRIKTILLLPFIPLYNCLAVLDVKRIYKKGSLYAIRNGRVCFYLPDLDLIHGDFIQNLIYLGGDYFDVGSLEKMKKYINPGAVVLDIGANIGNHSIFFAKECQAGKIYSFEPTRRTFEILERNIRINHLEEKVKAMNIALGDQQTKADVICVNKRNCGANKVNRNVNGSISMEALDNLAIKEKIEFIKIDVEGFEYEVLQGGVKTIDKNKPCIYIEIFDSNYDKVNSLLQSMNYAWVQKWSHDYLYMYQG